MTREGPPEGVGSTLRGTNIRLLELLACPECLAAVRETGAILACNACGREYSILEGVPQLLPASLTAAPPTGPAWQVWASALDRLVAWRRRTWNGGLAAAEFQRGVYGIQAEFAAHCRLAEAHGTVLDVGCGSADIAAALPPTCFYVGVDPLPLPRTGGPVMVRGVGERLPFRTAAFDFVMALETLDHCQSPESMLAEILRVLKSTGTLCVEQYVTNVGWRARLARWWRGAPRIGYRAPADSPKVVLLEEPDVLALLRSAFAEVSVDRATQGSHLFLAALDKGTKRPGE